MGFPGIFYSSNITPAAVGDWTDSELIRAIAGGVSRDGTALFPVMPYLEYGALAQEDLYSIIAYLRTLHARENDVPERTIDFPMNLIVRTLPQTPRPHPNPDPSDPVAYGEYLSLVAGCAFCHTPAEQGTPVPGMEFAGGFVFEGTWGTVRSANLTPEPDTGIGGWEKEYFVELFKVWDTPEPELRPVEAGDFNTVMPWHMYAKMTEEDLSAIFDFLQTVKPVRNQVEIHTPPATGDR
jgi:hypothetical protein